jgi:tetratricopeptide (TPR) repeat protein
MFAYAFGLAAALTLLPSAVSAQRAEGGEAATPAPTIDPMTGRVLTEAIEFFNAENYAAAKESISGLNFEKLSPYERGRVEQLLSGIAFAEEDYPKARDHLQAALASGGLNEQEILNARYQIAQLYIAEENWKEGAAALEEWFKVAPNPNSQAYYLLAIAYYSQDDFDRALPPAQKAVEIAEQPQESWIQLVVALLLQNEDYADAVPWLERLVAMAPEKKSHWMSLSSVYQQLEEYSKALAVTQVAYSAGLLSDDTEIRRLADLLMYNEIPYRCAQILEKGIADKVVEVNAALYEKLANCWVAAQEFDKSVAPLESAAQLAENGDGFVRLGQVHIQREDWPAAVSALQRALDKGRVKDAGEVQLFMGIALFNQEKYREARDWFVRAANVERHRQMARGYLQLIDSKAG